MMSRLERSGSLPHVLESQNFYKSWSLLAFARTATACGNFLESKTACLPSGRNLLTWTPGGRSNVIAINNSAIRLNAVDP